jgi:3-hydroxyisobutyrate dehydrogenase-like beta-hydroxyacid dehydrogenase
VTRVGFVGAGQLGQPMVERLLDAGHEVTVFARKPEVRAQLEQAGAATTAAAAEAAQDAEVFIACLFSDAQLTEVAPAALEALPAGAFFASHVTGTAASLRDLADAAGRLDAVVDAPVSGTADDIRTGRLTVLLGGSEQAVRACTPVISAYASTVVPTGELGTALAVKLVNNLLFAANVQLVAEAVQLGAQLGLEERALTAALRECSSSSRALEYLSGTASLADTGRAMAPFLAKDVAACTAAAAERGFVPRLLLDVAERGPLPLAPAAAGGA